MSKVSGKGWIDVRYKQPITEIILREEIEKPSMPTWLTGPVMVATFGSLALFFGLLPLSTLIVYGLFRPKEAWALGKELLEQYKDNDVRPWK